MGVEVRVTLYAPDADTAQRATRAAFERFAELDAICSDYRKDSELMRLCAQAGGPPIPVSTDLFTLLQRSEDVARLSGGAFDITCGPLVRLWREARKTGKLPSADALQQARIDTGWFRVQLDSATRSVRLAPGTKLDLGGIAKGYACDAAIAVLRKEGIDRAMVEAGGDIVASGPPPGKLGWRIEIFRGNGSSFMLRDSAASTSGDAEQFVVVGGKRYSHIVDPRTGIGLTNRRQVTVLAKDGLTTDALATALCILGPSAGSPLLERYGAEAITIGDAH